MIDHWHYDSSEPYIPGGQPLDDRIYVDNRVERAPDYTEGETEWVQIQLKTLNCIRFSRPLGRFHCGSTCSTIVCFRWRVSEIIISDIQRKDDGLYECQARNEGGEFFKSGHIQVRSTYWHLLDHKLRGSYLEAFSPFHLGISNCGNRCGGALEASVILTDIW